MHKRYLYCLFHLLNYIALIMLKLVILFMIMVDAPSISSCLIIIQYFSTASKKVRKKEIGNATRIFLFNFNFNFFKIEILQ